MDSLQQWPPICNNVIGYYRKAWFNVGLLVNCWAIVANSKIGDLEWHFNRITTRCIADMLFLHVIHIADFLVKND